MSAPSNSSRLAQILSNSADNNIIIDASDALSGTTGGSSSQRKRYRIPEQLHVFLSTVAVAMESPGRSPLSGKQIALCLYGLKGLTTDSSAVRRVLRLLASDLQLQTEMFRSNSALLPNPSPILDGRDIGN